MQKFIFGSFLLILSGIVSAQQDSLSLPPYKRFPTVPPFKLLKPDSISIFSKADLKKNKATMIMLFSPECDHCKHETEEIISRIDDFKKIQIVMATMMSARMMQEFNTKYDLGRFENITVGKDIGNMLPGFYAIHNLPFLAFYDKKGKLIDVFEGAPGVEKMLAKFE